MHPRPVQAATATAVAVLGLAALTACGPEKADARPGTAAAATASAGTTADTSAGTTAGPGVRPGASGGASGSASAQPDLVGSSAPAQPSAPAASAARRVVDARQAGGLAVVVGQGAVSDVPVDPGEMRDGMHLVAQNYARPGRPRVLVVAVDNVPEDTSRRREHLWRGMLDRIRWDYDLGQPSAEPVADPGPLGGSVECMLASLSEDGNVLCGWADGSTAGVALFPDSTVPEASRLFVAMRSDLER